MTAVTTDALTTMVPVWAFASKPQKPRCNIRSAEGPTGQPDRQVYGTSAAVTVLTVAANGATAAVPEAVNVPIRIAWPEKPVPAVSSAVRASFNW